MSAAGSVWDHHLARHRNRPGWRPGSSPPGGAGAGNDDAAVLHDLLWLAPGYATTFRDLDAIYRRYGSEHLMDPSLWRICDEGEREHYRQRNTLARATLVMVDDKEPAQLHQIELHRGEVRDKIQRLGNDGFGAVPLPGASAVVSWQNGHRGMGAVIGIEDGRYRARGYKGGERHVTMIDGAKADGTGGTLRKLS